MDSLYMRGGRRSSAPTYTPWAPPQSAAAISQEALASLLRGKMQAPQQAQMQAPEMQQQGDASPMAMQQLLNPGMLQRMIQETLTTDPMDEGPQSDAGNNPTDMGFDANAAPADPRVVRAIQFAARLGLGGLIGPMGPAMFDAVRTNSPAPMLTAAINSQIPSSPELGLVRMLTRAVGIDDPVRQVVDRQIKALTKPPAATLAQPAPGTVSQAGTGGVVASGRRDNNIFNGTVNRNFLGDQFGGDVGQLSGDRFGGFSEAGFGADTDSEGNTGSSNGGNGGVRGGGSFGEGQY